MKIIEVIALDNGAHRNQTFHNVLPEGWAVIPDNMVLQSFPFGEVIAEEINGVMTVTKWIPGEFPIEPEIILTPSELREQAYNTEAIIEWEGKMLTVTEAAQLWQYYAAEGSLKATILQELITDAKMNIRLKYPD